MVEPAVPINPPALPAGFSLRPLRSGDAAAVVGLIRADEIEVLGESYLDLADLVADWGRPSFELGRDAVGVVGPDGVLVAFGELSRPERAAAAVSSAHRGRGLGTVVADWIERRATGVGASVVGQGVPAVHREAVQLLRGRGYALRWTSWVLELPEGVEIGPPELPTGWTIGAFRPGVDDRAVHRVVEDAFGEWPDRPPVAFEDWSAFTLGRPGFEPWQLQVLTTDSGVVVGVAALALTEDGQGWIEQLAVVRAYRGRGLGRALLAAGFAATRAHGARSAMLSTDSRTGALDLYLHVGMVVTAEFVQLALPLGGRLRSLPVSEDDPPGQSDIYVLGGSRFVMLDDVLYTASLEWARAIHAHLPDINDVAWGSWWAFAGEKPCSIEYALCRAGGVVIRRTRTNVRVHVRRGVWDGPVDQLTAVDGRDDAEAVVRALRNRFELPPPPPIAPRDYEFHLE